MKLSALEFVMIRHPEFSRRELIRDHCPDDFDLENGRPEDSQIKNFGPCARCWSCPAMPKVRESFNK